MLILVIIAVILLVSYGLNMYVEENNKEVTKEFIEELAKQNEILREQNKYLKNLRKITSYIKCFTCYNVSRETFLIL